MSSFEIVAGNLVEETNGTQFVSSMVYTLYAIMQNKKYIKYIL
jgi:hypothetical protein